VDDDVRAGERLYLRGLGKRIRLLRVDRELSQEQLADAAGMSRNFVSSIERGAHGVDVVRLLRLASALDVDIGVLVSEPPFPAVTGGGFEPAGFSRRTGRTGSAPAAPAGPAAR
jgi:transcriptional regulator with XRE-family HTH domain